MPRKAYQRNGHRQYQREKLRRLAKRKKRGKLKANFKSDWAYSPAMIWGYAIMVVLIIAVGQWLLRSIFNGT